MGPNGTNAIPMGDRGPEATDTHTDGGARAPEPTSAPKSESESENEQN